MSGPPQMPPIVWSNQLVRIPLSNSQANVATALVLAKFANLHRAVGTYLKASEHDFMGSALRALVTAYRETYIPEDPPCSTT